MIEPYYADESVTLFLGDMREVLPALAAQADAVVTDPPYGETSLAWDRWPEGWPALVEAHTSSMWCFGSMRMFLDRVGEFAGWRLSQDVVWEKHNGTGFAADRLKRVHELALHWYRGDWGSIRHDAPREEYHGPGKRDRVSTAVVPHTGAIGGHTYEDDGTRMVRSVIKHPSTRGGLHPTEKPAAVLAPLIEYAVPAGDHRHCTHGPEGYQPFPEDECAITNRRWQVLALPGGSVTHPRRTASGWHVDHAALVWLADRRCVWSCPCECRAGESTMPQPIVLVPTRAPRRKVPAGQEELFGVMVHG